MEEDLKDQLKSNKMAKQDLGGGDEPDIIKGSPSGGGRPTKPKK